MNHTRIATVCLLALAALLTGCDLVEGAGVDIPFYEPAATEEALPTNTPAPTATPPPQTEVVFNVQYPASTPLGSAIRLVVYDFVTGKTLSTHDIEQSGVNTGTVTLQTPDGALLRYSYERMSGGQVVPEITAGGGAASYRTVYLTDNPTVNDIVASWADLTPAHPTGVLLGAVRDASSGQGVPGVVVAAAGRQTLSGGDGQYAFYDVAAGQQYVTIYALDGRWRAQTQIVNVPTGESAALDFNIHAARTVRVGFIASLPANTVKNAPLRLAGNVLQLGNTFRSQPGGSTVVAAREPVLNPLEDGRWSITLPLYEGTHLRYNYTLGDSLLNAELRHTGEPMVREIVLPGHDITLEDQIQAWETSVNKPVTYEVIVPSNTPNADRVTMQLKIESQWLNPIPLWYTGDNTYGYTLYNPLDFPGEASYRICRNYQCGAADDVATFGANPLGYRFTSTVLPQNITRNVGEWMWFTEQDTLVVELPETIDVKPDFIGGVALPAEWHPTLTALTPTTFDRAFSLGAGWIKLQPTWDTPAANPPEIAFNFEQDMLPDDLVQQIQNIHARGLHAAVAPQLRPDPEGPFAGNLNAFWESGARDAAWWDIWFSGYRNFVLYHAHLAALNGVEMLYIGDYRLEPALPGAPGAPADADARWRNLIADVRSRFGGKLAFQLRLGGIPSTLQPATPPAFLDALDVIDVAWEAPLTDQDAPPMLEMVMAAGQLADTHLLPINQQFGKPIVLTPRYASVNRGATQCVTLDSLGCLPFESFAPTQPKDSRLPIDLSEQADVYQTLFRIVNGRPWIIGLFSGDYNPAVTLRDKSVSVRGKPAEGVLKAWFEALREG